MTTQVSTRTLRRLRRFIEACKRFQKQFPADRTPLMFGIKKVSGNGLIFIENKERTLRESIEDVRVRLASREDKDKEKGIGKGDGNIIEENVVVGNTVVAMKKFTAEKQTELNKQVRVLSNTLEDSIVTEEEVPSFLCNVSEYSDIPFEYLEPFYDFVLNRLTQEEEMKFFIDKEQETKP